MRKALSVLFMVSLVFVVPGFAFAADKDCDDFASQEEAQKYFDEKGYSADYDPERLDKDNDGIPCEDDESSGNGGSDNSGSGSDNSDSNSGSSNQGGQLPKTATSYPTSALVGSGILAAGVGLLLYRRKLSA